MLMNAVMLVKETVGAWVDDRCARLGAALAFYSIFSIAPLLIIAIAIAGMVFGEEAARGEIVGQIGDTIGPPAAKAIEDMLAGHTIQFPRMLQTTCKQAPKAKPKAQENLFLDLT